MLDIPSKSAIAATIGVLVGVTLAYLQVRTLVKQRQTDLVVGLYSYFGSRESQKAWKEIMTTDLSDYEAGAKKAWWMV